MTERDAFETRLHAAIRAYVGSVSSELDPASLAHRIAEGEPRRHGFPAVVGWRGIAIPRAAWALLLLAALLAALVGGTLLVGSQLQARLPAVVPPVGQVFECPPGSTPDEPGPADQARPLAIPHLSMAFDRRAGRLVALVDVDDAVETWTFDVCTNTWTPMQSGSGPDTGLALVYDPGADLIIGVDYPEGPVPSPPHAWAYSLADNTWTRKGLAPDHVVRLWYDVASARVAAWAAHDDHDPGTIWAYDGAADTWAMVGALEVLGGFPWGYPDDDLLAYDASLDRVVATVVGGSETRLFDTRTASMADARAAAPWAGQCGFMSGRFCYGGQAGAAIAYDERAQRVIVLIGGHAFAYDAAADRWDTLFEPAGTGPGELARAGHPMVYDPVNRRLVVLAGDFDGDPDPVEAVLAFDTTTREWTVLLEPSRVPPSPSP
ncbi:MAG: hypothetical protein MUE92_11800 [Chloroflexi bacterium]|nr:hypothetical protein [Chloroflexota bacterium]